MPAAPGLVQSARLARAPLAAFAAMGVAWGGFAAELPDIKAQLAVDEARLGLLLFATPLAAVLAMLAAPVLARALGGQVLWLCTMAMALAFALPGQTASWALFPLAMMACGAGTGATDVLMNARMAEIEGRLGHSLMNLAHAFYSFGYAGGALAVGALRSAGWAPAAVMLAVALAAVLIALATREADGRIGGLERPRGRDTAPLGWAPLLGGR